jgi:CelD/BcsL family acetyltransferase involved in cellulose biosynthesis
VPCCHSRRLDQLVGNCQLLAGASVRIYRSVEECEPIWRAAISDGACFGFQCFEWIATWQATIGAAEGVAPLIVHLADRDGGMLLFLPLGIYYQHKLRVLSFLGGKMTDYNAPIIAPRFAENISAVAFAELWRAIVEMLPPVDAIWLRRMPATIHGIGNPMARLVAVRQTECTYAARLPGSFAAFQEHHDRHFFSGNRRYRRRLSEQGRLTFELPRDPAEALRLLAILLEEKSRRLRAIGAHDTFADPRYRRFYESLTRTSFQAGRVHICRLAIGDQIIAIHFGLLFRGRLCGVLMSWADQWRRFAPGRLLLEEVVKCAIADAEIEIFDLTVGDERYKRHWTDHSEPIYEYFVPRSLGGAVLFSVNRMKQVLVRIPWLRVSVCRIRKWLANQGTQRGDIREEATGVTVNLRSRGRGDTRSSGRGH